MIGIAIGIAGALLLTRSMTSLLFGVSAADPFVYVGVSALLAAVALIAVVRAVVKGHADRSAARAPRLVNNPYPDVRRCRSSCPE